VVAEFSGEGLSTEGGALLLRAADRKIGLLRGAVFYRRAESGADRASTERDAGAARLGSGAGLRRPERSG
jgi:hypothetical protein